MATIAGLALSASVAQASITINLNAGAFNQADGTDLPKDSTVVLLADTTGSGFGSTNFEQAFANTYEPAGTKLLGRRGTGNSLTDGGFAGTPQPSLAATIPDDFSNLAEDNQLALAWFDKTFDSSASAAGEGVDFGMFVGNSLAGDAQGTGRSGFDVPANGANVDREFSVAPVNNADFTDQSVGTADLSTVPEPASLSLIAVGGAMLVTGRRQRRRKA
jgi:hypothetical protein